MLVVDERVGERFTATRPGTLRRYALEAGFREVEILPIEQLFFRFYRLRA